MTYICMVPCGKNGGRCGAKFLDRDEYWRHGERCFAVWLKSLGYGTAPESVGKDMPDAVRDASDSR